MIQIKPRNIREIEQQHLKHCKPYVESCLNFYDDLFKRIKSGQEVKPLKNKSILNYYNLHASTVKRLIQPFLAKAHKKANIGQIKNFLSLKGNSNIFTPICNLKALLRIIEVAKNRLDTILIGSPLSLNKIKSRVLFTHLNEINEGQYILEQIFRYENLIQENGFTSKSLGSSWGSYDLTTKLGVNVCPYCNRNWINTVGAQRKKITNPQLDHYFDKAKHPILRLSLYNLIPSCETCNARLKKSTKMKYGKHLHPYEEGYGSNIRFQTDAKDVDSCLGFANKYNVSLDDKEEVDIELKNKVIENHQLFKIDKIYAYHGDIVAEVYFKRFLYSVDYLKILQENIRMPLNVDLESIYRIAFSTYLNEEDFNKRPFSKLMKDIARQLKMINND